MKKTAKAYVAADIMSKNVICVTKDADLRDLGKLFLAKGITGAPVIDRDGDICGVISQTDLLYYQLTRDDELVDAFRFLSDRARRGAGRSPRASRSKTSTPRRSKR